jgi:Trk-type K+ transport system membrane component
VSCSAITDTGLTPIQLALNYTGFGQAIVLVLMEIGGIGIMAIIFLIWNTFRRKNKQDINHIIVAQQERGGENISNTQRLITRSVILLIIVQIICAFIIAF